MADRNVVVVMPVAHRDRCAQSLPLWLERGYTLCLGQDRYKFDVREWIERNKSLLWDLGPTYIGWPKAVNWMSKHMVTLDFDPDLFVAAGDDMRPDPNLTAQQMADRYFERFPEGLGVMQPVGDPWSDSHPTEPRIAKRICGSPIFGARWAWRAYAGAGPLCPAYYNFYADEELLEVARARGCLWQDEGTSHYHDHYTRSGKPTPCTFENTQRLWDFDKATFDLRRKNGFPGSEVIV
jgi:hypothetical protein